ncbi:MAG: FAD:protein FMN transferase [Cohaesibacteraceae bacterium]|nr:FAD:protein FMN transferase [Cohaesibacteraceae bacterium]
MFIDKITPGPIVGSSKTPSNISKRYALNGPTMGTRYSAVFYSSRSLDIEELSTQLQAAVNEVDDQMSPWKQQSALVRLNQTPVGTNLKVPEHFGKVLARAQYIGSASNGAFNMAVGEAINAWGFGPHRKRPHPDKIRVAKKACFLTGAAVLFDPVASVARRVSDVQIDLCGIAKGYGVDRLCEVLEAESIEDYLVAIDGEMRSSGQKPNGLSWIIGVEEPDPGARKIAHMIELNDLAIASSGNYRHQVVQQGFVSSHTMDPSTGSPVRNNLNAVTVVADDCMSADAWATALLVMGEIDGPRFAETHGLSALFFIGDQLDRSLVETGIFLNN